MAELTKFRSNPEDPPFFRPPPAAPATYDYASMPPQNTSSAALRPPRPAAVPAESTYMLATEPEYFNGQPQTEPGALWKRLGRASDYRAGDPNPPGFYGGAGGNMPSTDGPTPPAPGGVVNAAPTAGSTAEGDRLMALGNPAHALRPSGTLSGTGIDGQPTSSGFRTIRRPGETPMLTNVNDPFDPSRAAQGSFIRDDQTGATLGVPAGGLRSTAPAAPDDTPWFMKDSALGNGGQKISVRTLNPAGSENMYGSEMREVPNMAGGRALRLRSAYQNLVAQGLSPAEAADQAQLTDDATHGEGAAVRTNLGVRAALTADRAAADTAKTNRINADAATANAGLAGIKARIDIAKAQKDLEGGGKFELNAPKADPNGLPYKDPVTGETKFPMLAGSVKIGDTQVPFQEADANRAQALAEQYIARYRKAYPDATDAPETLFNRFYQQSVLDVLGNRMETAQ